MASADAVAAPVDPFQLAKAEKPQFSTQTYPCFFLSLCKIGERNPSDLNTVVQVLVAWAANNDPTSTEITELSVEWVPVWRIGLVRYQEMWDAEVRFQKQGTPADTEHLNNCAGCGLDTPPGVSDSTINWACCNKCHHWQHLNCIRPKYVHSDQMFYKEIRDFPFTTSQDLEKDDDWICQFCLDPSLIMPPAHQQAEIVDLTV